jgi:hypothetical protein
MCNIIVIISYIKVCFKKYLRFIEGEFNKGIG